MPQVTRILEFDAGHRVLGHEGRCKHLHGHRYVAEITVIAPKLDSLGRVIDFGIIKERVGKWIDDNWDHNMLLNSSDPLAYYWTKPDENIFEDKMPYFFQGVNPTAEVIAEELYYRARNLLPEVEMENIRIWETPNCCADFRE